LWQERGHERAQRRDHAILTACAAGLAIEHLERNNFRREDRVAEVLQQRGDAPGLVHVFSAMEACQALKPWHEKTAGRTGLRPTAGKCQHFYLYFLLVRLGLVYVRVSTWLPLQLHFQVAARTIWAEDQKHDDRKSPPPHHPIWLRKTAIKVGAKE